MSPDQALRGAPAMRHFSSNAQVVTDQVETLVPDGDAFARFSSALPDAPAKRQGGRPEAPERPSSECIALSDVPVRQWNELRDRVVEPNAFYDPIWCRTVADHARSHDGVKALLAWDQSKARLIGLLPVHSARRAFNLPLPLLVAWNAYAPLTIPLLDRDAAEKAAGGLIDAATATGQCALLMPHMMVGGPAFAAIEAAVARRNLQPHILHHYERAGLDAAQDADVVLHAALGAKKLKELRRQRKRLSDLGTVGVTIASTPKAVARALENFLLLEAHGWKGLRGTALLQDPGDAAFIRMAAPALAANGCFEIITLKRNDAILACGLILRQADRAFFFKLTYDEDQAKASPGVQLTLELTRHLCGDDQIHSADSTADADHPMIDHIWRGRLAMGDVFIPLRTHDPVTLLARNLITARNAALDCARPVVRFLRKMKDQLA